MNSANYNDDATNHTTGFVEQSEVTSNPNENSCGGMSESEILQLMMHDMIKQNFRPSNISQDASMKSEQNSQSQNVQKHKNNKQQQSLANKKPMQLSLWSFFNPKQNSATSATASQQIQAKENFNPNVQSQKSDQQMMSQYSNTLEKPSNSLLQINQDHHKFQQSLCDSSISNYYSQSNSQTSSKSSQSRLIIEESIDYCDQEPTHQNRRKNFNLSNPFIDSTAQVEPSKQFCQVSVVMSTKLKNTERYLIEQQRDPYFRRQHEMNHGVQGFAGVVDFSDDSESKNSNGSNRHSWLIDTEIIEINKRLFKRKEICKEMLWNLKL
eukprot:403359992